MSIKNDIKYLKKTFALAKRAEGLVSPDPLVGAVVVKNGKIVGKGYHKKFKSDHAEAIALADAAENTVGSTLYVNLEPCCHWGNNPPCTDVIINSGVRKVVFAIDDPNPLMNNCSSLQLLTKAGIKVDRGLLQEEAGELNKFFLKYITEDIPFVTLKMATTLDGKTADRFGNSKWISNEQSRKNVQLLRFQHDAICVGVNTVICDDPRLSVRMSRKKKELVKVILDKDFKIPLQAKLLSLPGPIFVYIDKDKWKKDKAMVLKKKQVQIISISKESFINKVLIDLGQRKIMSLLVEGGASVASSFLQEGAIDQLILFKSPKILADNFANPIFSSAVPCRIEKVINNMYLKKIDKYGDDLCLIYRFYV